MNIQAKLLFLGTGGSMGIPLIGCHCPVCSSSNPHNKRLRPSALVSFEGKKLLIDCGPDYRQQALKYKIEHLDGVLITHAHNDHSVGIDELRVYHMHSHHSLPCVMSKETMEELSMRFYYIFKPSSQAPHSILAKFKLHILEQATGHFPFLGLDIAYTTFEQAGMKVNGFKLGNLGYVSDIRDYSPAVFEDLAGVEILIVSALRYTPSPLHLSIDEAIEFSRKLGARQTWFTHIAHDLDHDQVNAYLPETIRMAYDGLEIDFIAKGAPL